MATISAFADEIDPNLDVQMDVCESHGIRHIELRSIQGENVSKFTLAKAKEYGKRMAGRGFSVSCVGSPLGKIHIDEDLEAHLDLTRHCCELANVLGTKFVRIFSFYGPEGGNILDHRAKVMGMLARQADVAAKAGVTLLHENERGIYGAKPEQIKDIFATVAHPNLKSCFDPGNFVEEEVRPLEAWNGGLGDLTAYFHMKDTIKGSPTCLPVGEGNGQVEPILADAKRRGYNGVLALEPHMAQAGQFAGFSGPERFGKAVAGLKKLCDRVGLKY